MSLCILYIYICIYIYESVIVHRLQGAIPSAKVTICVTNVTWETQQHGSTSALDGVLWDNFQVLSARCNNSKQMETLSLYSLHLGEDVTWLVWFTWLFLCARWTGIVSDWCDSSLYLYIVNCLVWDWTSIKSVLRFFIVFCWVNDFICLKITLLSNTVYG